MQKLGYNKPNTNEPNTNEPNTNEPNTSIDRSIQTMERDLLNSLMKNSSSIMKCCIHNYWVMHSPETKLSDEIKDDIILITQFYISPNKERHDEILKCLKFNLNNKTIDKVYLITERTYTEDEMKIADNSNKSKITQI